MDKHSTNSKMEANDIDVCVAELNRQREKELESWKWLTSDPKRKNCYGRYDSIEKG